MFVDCGAYDGDTVKGFKKAARKAHIQDYQVVAFEPDEQNYRNLRRNEPDVRAIKAGVWNRTDILRFSSGKGDGAHIMDFGQEIDKKAKIEDSMISVQSIDETLECKNAALIKMDIEGAEKPALYGAKNTILKNKPNLAICIYHSDEDMVEIPLLIHKWVPEYKLYIRQHSNGIPETVLYAVYENSRVVADKRKRGDHADKT